ncbi:MAG TPA: hypothetical protein VFS43_26890 [Polyangiaceae bacterium]|nr:hypothetical protein [Polyangiaceae bacterium]
MAYLVEVAPEREGNGPIEYVTAPGRASVLGPKVHALRYQSLSEAENVAARLRASWVSYGHTVSVVPALEAFPTLEAALASLEAPPPPRSWYRRVLDALGL